MLEIPSVPQLPWLQAARAPAPALVVDDPGRAFLHADAGRVKADTGDSQRDFRIDVFTLNTGRTQLATGNIGGQEIMLDAVRLGLDQSLADVSVQSLSDTDIKYTETILISVARRTMPLDQREPIYLAEPPSGEPRIKAGASLTLRNMQGTPLPTTRRDG